MAADPVRVGLVGYGFAGETFHAPLIAAEPRFRLAAVSSRKADKVRADLGRPDPGDLAIFADLREMIASDRVDLVVIASPNEHHAPLARAAIEAGRHVVVDKPFTLSLAEARDLAALAERTDRLLSVFQNRRWDSDFLTVRDLIVARRIGMVTGFESRIDRFRPQVRDRWREGDVPGAGLLYDLGPHLIDQAMVLFGVPDTVHAVVRRQREGARADDMFRLTLGYGRLDVMLSAGMLVAGGTARILVHGTGGSLVKHRPDIQEDQLRAGLRPGTGDWGADPDPALVWDGSGSPAVAPATPGDQRGFYRALAAALLDGGENPVPPAQAVGVMAVIDAAQRSAAEERAITPDLSAGERAAWSGPAVPAGRL